MFSPGKYFILVQRVIEHIRLPWNKISCDIKLMFKAILANVHVESKNAHYSSLILQSRQRFPVLIPAQLPGEGEMDLMP